MTFRHDLTNRHGAPLCEFYGCRKSKRLRKVFNGVFCDQHRKVMGMLRGSLMEVKLKMPQQKTRKEWLHEYALRYVGMLLRKRSDSQHIFALQTLESSLLCNDV